MVQKFGNRVRSQRLRQDLENNGGGRDSRKVLKKMRSLKAIEESLHLEDQLVKFNGTAAEKKTPKKKKKNSSVSSSGSEPNYMKSTQSSEAKRGKVGEIDVSTAMADSERRQNPRRPKLAKILARRPSLRAARPLTRKKSFSIGISRATCSSTIKNFKFPNQLDLDPTLPLCSFSYCSMNSHHHHPTLPPLRCFLSGRRRSLKHQNKEIKFGEDEFFVEINAPEIKNTDRNSIKDYASETESNQGFDPICGLSSTETAVLNDLLQVENPPPLNVNLSDDDEEEEDNDNARGTTPCVYYDRSIQPCDGFATKDKSLDITSSGSTNPPVQEMILLEDDDTAKDRGICIYHDENIQSSDGSSINDKFLDITFSGSMNPPLPEMILPEDDSTAKDPGICIYHDEIIQPYDGSTIKDKLQSEERENSAITVSVSMKENSSSTTRSTTEVPRETESFNPRRPSFLPEKPKVVGEKVFLRHQSMEERMKREEWMVDYALQRAVDKLAQDKRNKVAPLVKVFETVSPCETTLHHEETKNLPHSMTIQACR